MRIIGLDIHLTFAEAVAWADGKLNRLGWVDMRRHLLEAFAMTLSREDVVVIEATGNTSSVAAVIAPYVKKVVIANPKQVRVIAHAKIKTDTIDASVLAQLYASGFLPEVWTPDEPTQALRRQVTRRNQIVRQRSRLKNIIQSILHSHLIPSCPMPICAERADGHGFFIRSCRRTNDLPSNDICASSIGSAMNAAAMNGRASLRRPRPRTA
jgi:transposase